MRGQISFRFEFVERFKLIGANLLEFTVGSRMIDEEYDIYKLIYARVLNKNFCLVVRCIKLLGYVGII